MAAAVRTWLTELRSGDPAAARAVGAVTLALLTAGDSLGPPVLRELGQAARLDDTHTALDRAYERGLDIMRDVRQAAADAATARKRAEYQLGEAQALLARGQEQQRRAAAARQPDLGRRLAAEEITARDHLAKLGQLHDRAAAAENRLQAFNQRLQQLVEMFRTRKEVLKATYTVAETERLIGDALAALEEQAQAAGGETGAERTTRRVLIDRPRQIRHRDTSLPSGNTERISAGRAGPPGAGRRSASTGHPGAAAARAGQPGADPVRVRAARSPAAARRGASHQPAR